MDKVNDNFFGVLVLDKYEEDVYRTSCVLNDKDVDIIIDYDLVKELDFFVDFIKDYDNKYELIKKETFNGILSIKNKDWRNEGEGEVSFDEIGKYLELEIVEFYGNCSVSLWFNDNDLFYGHYIIVDIKDITKTDLKVSFSLQ